MGIKDYSKSAASNNSAPPNGWPEGMNPSDVNDTARQNMADTRTWYEDAAWTDFGHTPVFVDTTNFKVAGTDVTADYPTGLRLRITDASTLYGTVSNAVFSTDTTITVTLDSGVLSGSISAVALSIMKDDKAIPDTLNKDLVGDVTGNLAGNVTGNVTVSGAVEDNVTTFNASSGLKDSGRTIGPVSGTAVSASGSSVTFTGLPSWVKSITVLLYGVSLSGTDNLLVQLGDSGGIETSGYTSVATFVQGATQGSFTSSNGVAAYASSAAGSYHHAITFKNIDGNKWVAFGGGADGASVLSSGGAKEITGTLTQVSLVPTGSDTFDAGTVNVIYE